MAIPKGVVDPHPFHDILGCQQVPVASSLEGGEELQLVVAPRSGDPAPFFAPVPNRSSYQHLPTGLRNGGLGKALTGFNW